MPRRFFQGGVFVAGFDRRGLDEFALNLRHVNLDAALPTRTRRPARTGSAYGYSGKHILRMSNAGEVRGQNGYDQFPS